MNSLTITLTNCPDEIMGMIEVAFKEVPTKLTGEPLKLSGDSINIDVASVSDPSVRLDIVSAALKLIIARGWMTLNGVGNEG